MKNNVIKFTVNPLFTSLENIMKQVNSAAEGKIIDGIFVERKSFFKSEVEVLLSVPKVIYIDKPVEIIKEVPVVQEVIKKLPKTSKYRGVSKFRGQYYARISYKGKSKFIGSYASEIDAARAYNKAAKQLHGENAVLNVLDVG